MKFIIFLTKVLLLVFLVVFAGCSKNDSPQQQNTQKPPIEEGDNPADTNLTPEEKFSASILIDFLSDSDDEDLAAYIETEIYKLGSAYNGAAVVEVTPSTWLVSLEKEGNVKNYLLQKYVDLKNNEYYFSLKETTLTLTDVVARRNLKIPAGQ
ncbi:MAG: hypothetical protein IT281_02435 [Ignavibacteria bacterium]|nr:hypothetical protein [Ignavibacteria bacterium]MCC7158377.1 hypothetical protein [Ignavibacteria bacterium]